MKVILLIILLLNFSFATYNITCKGAIGASTLYDFSKLPNSSFLAVEGEYDGEYIYGGIDPANSNIVFYDDNSPVCGGDGDKNILIEAYCHWSIDYCWDITLAPAMEELLMIENDIYFNNVIIVNVYPCLPRDTTSFSVGFYDWQNHNKDIGIARVNLSNIDSEYIETPTKKEAKAQRETCKTPTKPDVDLIQYVDDWENLLSNQISILSSLNSKINLKSFDLTLNNLNTTIEDNGYSYDNDIENALSNFTNNYKSTIKNSFISYSNVFGIGGYGSAPTPIKFTLLGHTYSLFDVKTFDEQIPFIRFTLLSFSYVWGSIIVFRMAA